MLETFTNSKKLYDPLNNIALIGPDLIRTSKEAQIDNLSRRIEQLEQLAGHEQPRGGSTRGTHSDGQEPAFKIKIKIKKTPVSNEAIGFTL